LVAHTVHVQPGHLLTVTKSLEGRVINEAGVQLTKRRWTIFFKVIGQRFIELSSGKAEVFRNPVQMNAAEHQIVGAIAGKQVLYRAGVGFVEMKRGLPRRSYVATHRFQQGNKAGFGQIVNLAIQTLEVSRIRTSKIGSP